MVCQTCGVEGHYSTDRALCLKAVVERCRRLEEDRAELIKSMEAAVAFQNKVSREFVQAMRRTVKWAKERA
jgi:uncharacterized protein (UPF0335 family)